LKKILLAVSAAMLVSVAVAHHSAAMFDHSKIVTYTGIVKEFQYTNPHSWLQVLITGPDGKTVEWGFEAEGPSTLQRARIRPSDFAPGTKLKITGRPMRDGSPAAAWVDAVRADGKRFDPNEGFKVK